MLFIFKLVKKKLRCFCKVANTISFILHNNKLANEGNLLYLEMVHIVVITWTIKLEVDP